MSFYIVWIRFYCSWCKSWIYLCFKPFIYCLWKSDFWWFYICSISDVCFTDFSLADFRCVLIFFCAKKSADVSARLKSSPNHSADNLLYTIWKIKIENRQGKSFFLQLVSTDEHLYVLDCQLHTTIFYCTFPIFLIHSFHDLA